MSAIDEVWQCLNRSLTVIKVVLQAKVGKVTSIPIVLVQEQTLFALNSKTSKAKRKDQRELSSKNYMFTYAPRMFSDKFVPSTT